MVCSRKYSLESLIPETHNNVLVPIPESLRKYSLELYEKKRKSGKVFIR